MLIVKANSSLRFHSFVGIISKLNTNVCIQVNHEQRKSDNPTRA